MNAKLSIIYRNEGKVVIYFALLDKCDIIICTKFKFLLYILCKGLLTCSKGFNKFIVKLLDMKIAR